MSWRHPTDEERQFRRFALQALASVLFAIAVVGGTIWLVATLGK